MHKYIHQGGMLFSRVGIGVGSLLWAIHLLAAWSDDARYTLIHFIAPLYVWACLFLAHGTFVLYSMVVDLRGRFVFLLDGLLGFFLWSIVTLSSYEAYWPEAATFYENIVAYSPPAFLSGQVVVAAYAWWRFVLLWADCEESCSNSH